MKTFQKIATPCLLFMALIMSVLVISCSPESSDAIAQNELDKHPAQPVTVTLGKLEQVLRYKGNIKPEFLPKLQNDNTWPNDLSQSTTGQYLKLRYPNLTSEEAIEQATEDALDTLQAACLRADGVVCDQSTLNYLENNREALAQKIEESALLAIKNEISNGPSYVSVYEVVNEKELPFLSALKEISQYENLQNMGSFFPLDDEGKKAQSSFRNNFFDVFDSPLSSVMFSFINRSPKESVFEKQLSAKMSVYAEPKAIQKLDQELRQADQALGFENHFLQVFLPLEKNVPVPLGAFLEGSKNQLTSNAIRKANLDAQADLQPILEKYFQEHEQGSALGPRESPLNLLSERLAQFFETGVFKDPLATWESIEDARFKNIDLRAFFAKNVDIRKELFDLREGFIARFWDLYGKPDSDFTALTKEMTKATMEFTAKHIEKALPQALTPEDLMFLVFGSAARGESGPYTDLEGALLFGASGPEAAALGQVVAQSLANDFFGALEHPHMGVKGWRLDEADNSPFHKAFFANGVSMAETYCMVLNALMLDKPAPASPKEEKQYIELAKFRQEQNYPFEGSLAFSTSAGQLASYYEMIDHHIELGVPSFLGVTAAFKQTAEFEFAKKYLTADQNYSPIILDQLKNASCGVGKDNSTLVRYAVAIADRMNAIELSVIKNFANTIGRNYAYVFGNKKFYNDFVIAGRKTLAENDRRTRLAMKLLKEMIPSFGNLKKGGVMFIQGTLPGAFDLKRMIYRFEEQTHTNMGFLKGLYVQNQADIVVELNKRGIYGTKFKNRTLARINLLNALRWRDQILVHGQLETYYNFSTQAAFDEKLKSLENDLAKNQRIVDQAFKYSATRVAMAKAELIGIKMNLKKMPKLNPSSSFPIYGPSELKDLQEKIIPEQMELFKRIVAFVGYGGMTPIPTAFQDNFNPNTVNLEDYGIKIENK